MENIKNSVLEDDLQNKGGVFLEPYFMQGDCIEILPKLNNVQLIITDPPYGILNKAGWIKQGRENKMEESINCIKSKEHRLFIVFQEKNGDINLVCSTCGYNNIIKNHKIYKGGK